MVTEFISARKLKCLPGQLLSRCSFQHEIFTSYVSRLNCENSIKTFPTEGHQILQTHFKTRSGNDVTTDGGDVLKTPK